MNDALLGIILLCFPCRSADSHVCLVCSSHQGLWIHCGRLEVCEGSCQMNTFSRVHDSLHPMLSLGWCIVHPSRGQLSHARATIKGFGTSICIWVGFSIQAAIIAFCLTSDQRHQQRSWINCNEVMAICWGIAPVLKLPSLLAKQILLKPN